MAGTSLDGVDAAVVLISGPPDHPRVELKAFDSTPYPARLRERLFRAAGGDSTTAGELSELNFRVGEAFARAALRACDKARISPGRVAVIGSHGQTIFHQGSAAGRSGASTLQIGEPAVIAARTGIRVVADFRVADMAAGGQGAPLVPLVDYLLLRDRREGTVALNLGGIANVTIIPVRVPAHEVFGFDTGPANIVLDALVRRATRDRRRYDAGGSVAAKGSVLQDVLERALGFPFFKLRPPKSAGREQFGSEFMDHYLPCTRGDHKLSVEDLLRTAAELTARSVVEALRRFVFPRLAPGRELHRLVVSGGGSHNRVVVRRLQALLPELQLRFSGDFGLPVDAKEAMAFAVLAGRTLKGLTGNLPAVTGARRAVVLGKLVQP
jgi:anhydro-N-acetylmuramic acid kinase